MDTNQKIVAAAWGALKGDVGVPLEPGWCLSAVRMIVEEALGLEPWGFYERFLVGSPKALPEHESWWARDCERILREKGLAVPIKDRKPGDLLFNYEAAYSRQYQANIGHVGILLEHDMVIENINPRWRPASGIFPSSLALTPFKRWPATLAVRLPEV